MALKIKADYVYIKILKPSFHLSEYIKCYWVLENNSFEHKELVYPTGETQILFHYGTPFYKIDNNGLHQKQSQTAVFGQITSMNNILSYKNSGVIGVVFLPYSLSAFLPFHTQDATNTQIDFSEIYKEWSNYENQYFDSGNYIDRIKIIENFLGRKLSVKNPEHYNIVKSCVENIINTKGIITVNSLCNKFQLNERTLERMFSKYVGISPKKYSEIIQFNSAVKMCSSKLSFTEISFNTGYFDQAHFIKSFKKYTGLTPSKFRKII